MNETQSVIVYRSKFEQEMDEYRGEIILIFAGLVLVALLACKIQDLWLYYKARRHQKKLGEALKNEAKKFKTKFNDP